MSSFYETVIKLYPNVLQKGEVRLKEWECVEVKDYKNIGARIKGRQNDGWRLHTYQAIGTSGNPSLFLYFFLKS